MTTGSRSVPWLKRLDLSTGLASTLALQEGQPLELRNHPPSEVGSRGFIHDERSRADELRRAYSEPLSHGRVVSRGRDWYFLDSSSSGTARPSETWLLHGTELQFADALYVFMEHLEARNPTLEAALAERDDAASVYADWLEEQGDPFAACLKPAIAATRGPAGLWWLEGLERVQGVLEVELREGFIRRATLNRSGRPWEPLVLRLLHLRAAVALEELSLDVRLFNSARGAVALSLLPDDAAWSRLPLPPSLKVLRFVSKGKPVRLPTDEVTSLQQRLRARVPGLAVWS